MSNSTTNDKKQNMRSVDDLIIELCDNILIKSDELNFNTVNSYLASLSKEEIDLLKHSDSINKDYSIVRNKLMVYIQSYQTADAGQQPSSPFDFDSGQKNLIAYRKYFENIYTTKIDKTVPAIFFITFNAIQDMSEHYRVFEQFYIIRSRETADSILSKATIKAEELAAQGARKGVDAGISQAVKEVQDAAKDAVEDAKINSILAAEKAEEASQRAGRAAQSAATFAVEEKMNDVTKTISENSVTILGIFAGIVLTIVAGLFYSSSVINNITTSNFYKLMSVSALVGFVCINLLAVMFYYVDRIKQKNETTYRTQNRKSHSNGAILLINIVLIVVMIVFAVLQFCVSDKSMVDVNITTSNDETVQDVESNEISATEYAQDNTNIEKEFN